MQISCFEAQRFRDEDGNNQVTSTVEDFIRQQRLGDDLDMFEDRFVLIK